MDTTAQNNYGNKIMPAVYTRGEEIFNMVSHIVGGAFGISALVLCVIMSVMHGNGYGVVSSCVYGAAMILMYTMSSVYHGLKHEGAKRVMRVLDHCAIYLLIAGTYTPLMLSAVRVVNAPLAWTVFGVEWGLAAVAVTLTAVNMKKFQVLSMICYIAMGWLVIAMFGTMVEAITFNGMMLVLAGGISYTIGAVLYGIGKKKKYAHNVFHVFVLIGSVFQFFGILLYSL